MKSGCRRRVQGFTLIEIVIVAAIFSIIGMVMVYIFRSNIMSLQWGRKHMEFNQKIQLAMKQVFTDIKKINPLIVRDENENLWFQGEKNGDLFPNLLTITDTDQTPDNGGEEITFVQSSWKAPTERSVVRLFLEEGALMREATDGNGVKKRMVISNKVAGLHFSRNAEDISGVRVAMEITDDLHPEMKEKLSFAVHLDTSLVCVVMK